MPQKPIQLAKIFLEPLDILLWPRKDYLLGCFGSFSNNEAGRVWLPRKKSYLYLSDMDLLLVLPEDFKLNQKWFWVYNENFFKKWRIPSIMSLITTKNNLTQIDSDIRSYLTDATKVLYGNPALLEQFRVKHSGRNGLLSIRNMFSKSSKNIISAAIFIRLLDKWEDAALYFSWNLAETFHSCGMALVRSHTSADYNTIKRHAAYLRKNNYFGLPYFGPYYNRYMRFKLKPRRLKNSPEFQEDGFTKLAGLFVKWWRQILADYWEIEDKKGPKGTARIKTEFEATIAHLEELTNNSILRNKKFYRGWVTKTLEKYLPRQNLLLFIPREIFSRYVELK